MSPSTELPLSIRGMAGGDIAAVTALEALCNPQPWTAEALRPYAAVDRGPAPATRASDVVRLGVVAEKDGTVIGYALATCIGNEAELLLLGVHPEARRMRAATRLLKDLLDRLRDAGAAAVFLEVRQGNTAALGLYRSLGFGQAGLRKKYYADTGEDALLLQAFLKKNLR